MERWRPSLDIQHDARGAGVSEGSWVSEPFESFVRGDTLPREPYRGYWHISQNHPDCTQQNLNYRRVCNSYKGKSFSIKLIRTGGES